jgi:hypothetical protein
MTGGLILLSAGLTESALGQPAVPASAPAAFTPGDGTLGPPAKNWVLPLFTDKEGFRAMTIRGSEAQAVGAKRIEITNLNITAFIGDATARVDAVLLAPSAHFFPDDKRAAGEKNVRFIRDEMEVTGERWTFSQTEKRVLIDSNVRVVLHAQLPAILK